MHRAALLPPAPSLGCGLLRLQGCLPLGVPRLHTEGAWGPGLAAVLDRPPADVLPGQQAVRRLEAEGV
eukprot:10635770-Alexandrium_andersonii.AAC.1